MVNNVLDKMQFPKPTYTGLFAFIFSLILLSASPVLADAQDPNKPDKKTETEIDAENEDFLDIKSNKEQLYQHLETVLSTYVDPNGLVNYSALRRHRANLIEPMKLLNEMHTAEYLAMDQTEKIAFWINAYNLCTLKLVIDNYPIEPKWFMKFFFPDNSVIHLTNARDNVYFDIFDLQYTLKEIEEDFLIKKFSEPRAFFAICYASMGAPKLRNEPYRKENLEEEIERQTRQYINSPKGFRLDKEGKTIYISAIFNWYSDAFDSYQQEKRFRNYDPKYRGFLNFVYDYLDESTREFLRNNPPLEIEYIRYNWELNEQPQKFLNPKNSN